MNRQISIKFCICIDIYIWSCYTLRTLSVHPSVRHPSVRPSVRLSVSASFPCSNFSTFWPIFLKLCIDIGIGEEWYGIASGLISFWNNRVMALDVCQKCFALHFRALTLVRFYRFCICINIYIWSTFIQLHFAFPYFSTELWPLIYVQNMFLPNVFKINGYISRKFC